jgi:hypothetical protein
VSEITASPLCWPNGWRRTKSRGTAKFRKGVGGWIGEEGAKQYKSAKRVEVGDGVTRVLRELKAMGIPSWNVIISSDLKLRNDGLPYAAQATAHLDPGVAVYWKDAKGQRRCMAIDRYDRVADNLAAIAATIEAMRAIERHGGAEILDRAFTGFAALPAPAYQQRPHEILGVDERATKTEIEYAYKRLAMQAHPDRGGSSETMSRINAARDAMLGAQA